MSMLLIPRLPGISTRKIEIGAGGMSATTYVTFEDVKVPAEYLVGEEGMGFKYTMSNFNHERLWIAFQAVRGSRICLEDTMKWCQKREAFGKTLIEQPVVRHKFGHMARQIDGLQSWIESIIYELDNMSHAQGMYLLHDLRIIGLIKFRIRSSGWRYGSTEGTSWYRRQVYC
jgi:alkylation response protein AidB-like acyl-CoA dehydrogenase